MSSNLSRMHRETCQRLGERTAVRYKQFGLYHDISWNDYRRQADWAAAGLLNLGIQPGDRIAMLSENRYEWLITDHAILSSAAVNVPLHAPLSAKQAAYQVGHSESICVVVSNQAQADKIFEVIDELSHLKFLVSFDPIEAPETSLQIVTWEGLKHRGRHAGEGIFEELQNRESQLTTNDLATIIYTSGTTGNPKGVMLTHGNLLSNAIATGEISYLQPNDVLLSWLPYSHIYARTVDHYLTSFAGIVVALAESIDTLVINLQEIEPTWLTAVPRFYEKIWNSIADLPAEDRRRHLWRIFGPNIRQLTSGGAPLPRHVCEGFFDADIPVLEGYGLTESSPVICFNNIEQYRIGTVGKAIADVDVKIAEDGEILTRGPHVMAGYWKNSDATTETIVDGWLQTGDVGHLDDDGFLTITDRKKDLIITSGGKNIAPSEIERLLTSDLYIDQAVLYGDGRQFISALIVPNFEHLDAKLDEWDCKSQYEEEFLKETQITKFFQARIDDVLQTVSPPERVKRFLLLSRPFQLESDELTATLKVRRRHIIEKYESKLIALYNS